jgi:pimeloyl-ACP methyl ester carboxylesterase
VPVLFISGTLDVKTPPANAEDILPGFPNGRHLLIDGGSHDDDLFLASPRIADAMVDFLKGGPVLDRVELKPLRFKLP